MKRIVAFVDACQKYEFSTHCWALRNDRGKYYKRHTTTGNSTDPLSAEIETLDKLVKYLEKKDLEDVLIITDSIDMYSEIQCVLRGYDTDLSSRLKPIIHSIKMLGAVIEYQNRSNEGITFVDKYATEMMHTTIKRENARLPEGVKKYTYSGLSRREWRKYDKYGDVKHTIPAHKQVKRHEKKYKHNMGVVKYALNMEV